MDYIEIEDIFGDDIALYLGNTPTCQNVPQKYKNGAYLFKRKDRHVYIVDSLFHRDDGPAVIYFANDKTSIEFYFQSGIICRDNSPAVIHYYDSGIPKLEKYYQAGKVSRDNEPAVFRYYDSGIIKFVFYYKNSIMHNEQGPAEIWYNNIGVKSVELYRLNGARLSKKEWEDQVKTKLYWK